MVLVIAAGSVGTVLALRQSLTAAVDSTARDDAQEVAAGWSSHGGGTRQLVAPEPDAVVQVVGADGSVLAGSRHAPSRPLLSPHVGPGSVTSVGRLPFRTSADSYRIAARRTADGNVVFVALPSDDVTDAVRHLTHVLAVGAPLLLVALILLAWVVVHRALRPVEQMHRRQREFVADAAHELRTPLAALQAQLEVAQTDPDDKVRAQLPVLADAVSRMSGTVEALLALARVDEGQLVMRDVDLDDVARQVAARVALRPAVTVDTSQVHPVRVKGDLGALSRLIDNLLRNAVRHASSSVAVGVARVDGEAVVTVSDDGPGVVPADRERIFERFARMDGGRARSDGGVGLGLAIVRAVADAHGGDVLIEDNAPGARFVVRLPAVRHT